MRTLIALLPLALGAVDALAPPAVAQARLTDPALDEASGVVASRRHPGVLWTHNDSGNASELFAIDREGRTLARFPLALAAKDWEDIALDARGLYIGDIGDNARTRDEKIVWRIDEPDPAAPATAPLVPQTRWRLRCPPGDVFDSEALVVAGDHGYLLDKRLNGRPGVYRFRLDVDDAPQVLERIGELPFSAPATGADLADDARTLAVATPLGLRVLTLPTPFPDGLAGAEGRYLAFVDPRCEACALVDGAVVTLSESRTLRWFSPPRLGRPFAAIATVDLPAAPPGLQLDGDLAEWTSAPLALIGGDDREAPIVRAAWSPSGLVVAINAPADAVAEVRVGVDADGREPEYGPGDERCLLAVGDGGVSLRWPRTAPAGVESAGRRAGDRWTAEMRIPAHLAAGGRLRFDCVITSAPRRCSWGVSRPAHDGAWSSPLAWAVAALTE